MNGKTTLPQHLRQTNLMAGAHHILVMIPEFIGMPVLLKRLGSIPIGSHLLDQMWRQLASVPLPVTTMSRHLFLLPSRRLSTLLQIQQLRLHRKCLSTSTSPQLQLQLQHLLLLRRCRSILSRRHRRLHHIQMALRESVLEEPGARAMLLFTTLLGWIRIGRLLLHQRCRHARRRALFWPMKDGALLTLLTLSCDLI